MGLKFEARYNSLFGEVGIYWNDKHLFTISESSVERICIDYEIHYGEAISLIVGRELKNALECEENGFFVSAVLTKLFNCGNDNVERG